jgi:hypothetical protein
MVMFDDVTPDLLDGIEVLQASPQCAACDAIHS